MRKLNELGYVEPIKAFVASGRPFMGICLGFQVLFEGSDECPGLQQEQTAAHRRDALVSPIAYDQCGRHR